MRILFLGHAYTNGCRTQYFFGLLRSRGASPEYVDLPSGPDRLRVLQGLPKADAILLQRIALTDREIAELRRHTERLVYDVDDPIMYRSSRHLIQRSLARRRRFQRMVAAADRVVCGSPLIAQEAARYVGSDRVTWIPSTVDAEAYAPRLRRVSGSQASAAGAAADEVVLGWLGSAGTLPYLARLRHVLAEAGRRWPQARLKIVSNKFPDLEGIPVERKLWSRTDEAADLASFDVALLPLADDLWTRGKGHGKLFQYMAAGAAIVASPVGVVGSVLTQGRTGLFARDRHEWIRATGRLVENRALRERLGKAARTEFEKQFSLQAVFPKLWRAFTEEAIR